ncbi:MAG TPA: isoprenylcysteine carboxylmethyltransferase family protein [Thermoanaerobaculia bacterium]
MIFVAAGSVAQNLAPVALGLPSFEIALAAGGMIVLVALTVASAGIYQMKKHRTPVEPGQQPTALVTSGVFARSRNPLYLSLLLVLVAIAVMANALWILVAAALFGLTIDRVVIAWEERVLDRTFPDEYRDYKRRVRRWI